MPIPKYRAKRDRNESEMLKALKTIPGLSVVALSAKDVPDLLIGYLGANFLVEVKNKKGRNRLQKGQSEFIASWNGQAAVVHTLEEILAILGIS